MSRCGRERRWRPCLQHVLWEDPIEHPQKTADIVIDIANPGAHKLAELLQTAAEPTANINPRSPDANTYADICGHCQAQESLGKTEGTAGRPSSGSRQTRQRRREPVNDGVDGVAAVCLEDAWGH